MNSLREENTKSLKLFRLILISGCMREFRFYRRSPVAFEELNSVASVSSSKIVAKKNERESVWRGENPSRLHSVTESMFLCVEIIPRALRSSESERAAALNCLVASRWLSRFRNRSLYATFSEKLLVFGANSSRNQPVLGSQNHRQTTNCGH